MNKALAQGRKARIGLIHYVPKGDPFVDTGDMGLFIEGMRKIGYHDGKNVEYLQRFGERNYAVTERHAAEIVDWAPDVIVSFMTNCNLALKPLVADNPIPIVCWATDLMAAGLIESYRRPGRNFTGFSYIPYNNWTKVRLLKMLYPKLNKVAHLFNPTYSPATAAMEEFRDAAIAMNMEFVIYETLSFDAFQPTIDAMKADGCEAVIVGPHELFNTNGATLGPMFLAAGLPAVGNQRSIVLHGGLASFNPGKKEAWPLMAFVVDDILNGASPAEIPINRNCRGPMTLNLKTARMLGLQVPAHVLEEADVLLD